MASVNDLKTVAQCDALLHTFNKQRRDLLARQARLQFTIPRLQESAMEVEAEIRMVTAELAFLDTVLPSLPEGPRKDDYLNDRSRQQTRLYQLNTKRENSGAFALLDKERELASLEKHLSSTDLFIADVAARREELLGGAA